jgi:Cu+-exporting ATPase
MKESKTMTKDPICKMSVDEASALHAERDGKTYYFCGDFCRKTFLSKPIGVSPEDKPRDCCG